MKTYKAGTILVNLANKKIGLTYRVKQNDYSFPKGHLEEGETLQECAVRETEEETALREVFEETGLKISSPMLCGIKDWSNDDGSRYMVLFYKTNRFSGQLKSSDEGEVFWIPRSELQNYNLSVDFMDMVKIFESDELSEFYYYKEDNTWRFKIL